MSQHKLNPNPGELWQHNLTQHQYVIHSLTDDGWVRYSVTGRVPLFTQPTLDFIQTHRKMTHA